MGNLLFLLGIQVPDQGIAFIDQNDQLIQQQLLSSLLGLRLLPVYDHNRGTSSFRPGHSKDDVFSLSQKAWMYFVPRMTSFMMAPH